MTWSTQELAHLAGTTVNAVRHYHSIGLLEAPERCCNGYKQYRVRHLVRVIQVRRLVELGIPLGHVRAGGDDAPVELSELTRLDETIQEDVERLLQARSDIAAILREHAPVHTPRGFESVAARLSPSDRAFILICTRLYDDSANSVLQQMVAAEPASVREEFDALRTGADPAARQHVARAIAASGSSWRSADLGPRRGQRARTAQSTIAEVRRELYNPAQREVLDEARSLIADSALVRSAA